jgi:hypothetical protein
MVATPARRDYVFCHCGGGFSASNPLSHMTLIRKLMPAVLLLVPLAGCNDRTRQAMGDEHSVIVVAEDGLWAQVEDTIMAALQAPVFAAREEATFRVSQISPGDPYWGDLRRFRQILSIGRPDDFWVQDPLRRAGAEAVAPAIHEASDVWARNQTVTVLVVPEPDAAAVVEANVDSIARLLDRRYRAWTINRMYTSGLDGELAERLASDAGFALDLPNVYRWRQVSDSAYLFINDQPDASQLVRSLLVTWRPYTERRPETETVLGWRDEAARRFYDWGQTTERDPIQTRTLDAPGAGGLEVRGVWYGTVEGFPQAGMFITRVIDCPAQDRRYLLDAWLYAPSRAKYQYIIQLETLLGTFECVRA